jgi:hypothetical protein
LMLEAEIVEGRYELGFSFNLLAGGFQVATGDTLPGVLTTIGGLILQPSLPDSPNGVDASELHVVKKKSARKRA